MSIIRSDSTDAYLAAGAPLIAHDIARSAGLRAWIEGVKRSSAPDALYVRLGFAPLDDFYHFDLVGLR